MYMDNECAQIMPGLYIGSYMAEVNRESLLKKGITHILQVGRGMQPSWQDSFTYLTLSIEDAEHADIVSLFG